MSERTSVAVPGFPVPASAIPPLRAIADRAAKENGGAVPSWISAVVTTRETALTCATPGAFVRAGGTTVVYLVTMKGDFKLEWRVLGSGAGGQRAPAPALHYMCLVVSAEEFALTAWGLSPGPPAVTPSSLGPLTWLKSLGAAPGRH
jgi:hypothetical protein